MARPSAWLLMRGGEASPASGAVIVLTSLLLTVIALTAACILLPLVLSRTRLVRGDAGLLAFFGAIGTGFMLIEVSMLQRLIVFLGHPVYSLSVILFVLLLAGGLGSYLSARIADAQLRYDGVRVLGALLGVLQPSAQFTVPLISFFSDAETPVRIAVSGALLAVMGIFMGMAFPIGHAAGDGVAPRTRGVAVGRERRDLGARLGPRRRHRHGRRNQRELLDRRRGLRGCACRIRTR